MFNFLSFFTIDRRVLFRFDWLLFFLAFFIGVIGIFNLYSAGSSFSASSFIFKKQIYWLFIGLFFLFLGSLLNYADIERYAYAFYLFSLFLLVLVWGGAAQHPPNTNPILRLVAVEFKFLGECFLDPARTIKPK